MPDATLVAVAGAGERADERPRVRRLSPAACRCRPSEDATWFRADLTTATGEAIRREASVRCVPVDAWVAVLLEYRLALIALDAEVPRPPGRARALVKAAVVAAPPRLASTPNARAWQSTLAGRASPGRDELPELVLPRRLLERAGWLVEASALVALADDWPIAKACESLACASGQTLEALVGEFAR